MRPGPVLLRNPFREHRSKPEWAQLTRLAGDAASILFEDLRKRVSAIDGLQEELSYFGPEWGWAPRYRVGTITLFIVYILPGQLEGFLALESSIREKLLASPRVAAGIKEAIRNALLHNETSWARVLLSSRSAVRSFARAVLVQSKMIAPRR